MYSRVLPSGLPHGCPCQPSTTCGPDVPRPRITRPPDIRSSVAAVIAVFAGVRPHPELAAEQAYVDHAYECLDKMRELLGRTQDATATEFAALAMEAWAKRRARTFRDAERGLCFGRLTLDGTLRPLYVGRRWVHDDAHAALVVNWQAPAARPFYTATPSDPQRVTQRRRFRTEGRRLVDISDEALDGSGV